MQPVTQPADMLQAWFMRLDQGPEGPLMQLDSLQEYGTPVTAVALSSTYSYALCEGAPCQQPWLHTPGTANYEWGNSPSPAGCAAVLAAKQSTARPSRV